MLNNNNKWEKLGRIVMPDKNISWMSTYAGPSFAIQKENSSLIEILVAGRDVKNRSLIGSVKIDLRSPDTIISISPDPVLSVGEIGAFDENGVSYPWLVNYEEKEYLFYVGWMPTVLTPFQTHLGLAIRQPDGSFMRVSKAPILERTNEDFLSGGSACALNENGTWKLWYTCFTKWGTNPGEHKHYYIIKYGESDDAIQWKRENKICIDIQNKEEFSIGRPSIMKMGNIYHMWYSYRGEFYRIGYAHSENGISWTRRDDLAGITLSESGWDSESVCYSHVFRFDNFLYMLYNGNNYGKEGLGLARLKL